MIVGSVTFLRAGDDELPRGECDDWRMHWMGWSSLVGAAGRIIGRATGRTTRSMLAVIDMVLPLVLWLGRNDSEVGRMGVDKRWKVKTKRKKGKVESSGRSSHRHPFLINNWHTGIFMRGRENIQVSVSGHLFHINRWSNPGRGSCPDPANRGVSGNDLRPTTSFGLYLTMSINNLLSWKSR
jgi:hypothetical protein